MIERGMGIQGFLPLLKSIMVPIHIKDLKGCSVAVDTYSWLHKGALPCSTELCKGMPTTRHIEYCMHRVNLLRHFGVKPILVFDGGLLPMKSEQENKRARARKDNLARAVEHESDGNSAAAYECYQKAVDISPQIACELIQVLKQENLQYIVAPYEADAQMTFLAISGQVDAVITEDSDLIPFGCPRIIFKMDKFGQGVQFQDSMLQKNKELSFEGFNRQMLLEMCILSGCDYLQSLSGMGLKRAHASIKKFRSYDKVLKHLRYSGVSVPPFYEESFKKAILTFQYQRQKGILIQLPKCHLRKFRAPRVSPTAANETKNSTASVIDSENWGSVPPPNIHIGYSSATNNSEFTESPCHEKKSPEHTVLRKPRQPIHKPCLGLHGHTNVQDTAEGKTREEATRKVTVRSAYFQHKQVEKNVYGEKQDCLSSGIAIDERKNALSE
ncbi:Exonuclease 1 [Glycine soja]